MPKYKWNILIVLIIFTCLFLIYLPSITTNYIYHDDVNFFLKTQSQPYPKSFHFSLSIGRYVGAPIYAAYGSIVHSISDLKIVRLISLLQISLTAFILYLMLNSVLKKRFPSLFISIAAVTLPSFQVLVTQAGYAFQSTGILLSLLAAYLSQQRDASTSSNIQKHIFHWRSAASFSLFLMAIATHPSTAMYYWVGVGIIALQFRNKSIKKSFPHICRPFVIGITTMLSYALLLKWTRQFHRTTDYGFYNPYSINTDILQKIKWFITEPLNNSLNLWNIFPNPQISITLSLVIIITLLYKILSYKISRKPILPLFFTGTLLFACFILSFSTNLLAESNAAFYRCCVALSSFLLIILIFCLLLWLSLFPQKLRTISVNGTCVLLFLFGGYMSYSNTTLYRINPSRSEMTHLLKHIQSDSIFQFQRIHLIRPDRKKIKNRYDEFGGPTSSFKGDAIGLISAGIRESVISDLNTYYLQYNPKTNITSYIFIDSSGEKKAFHVTITSAPRSKAIHGTQPTLMIDMTELYHSSGKLSYLRK